MPDHAFLPNPWGKDLCDALYLEGDRQRRCNEPRAAHAAPAAKPVGRRCIAGCTCKRHVSASHRRSRAMAQKAANARWRRGA